MRLLRPSLLLFGALSLGLSAAVAELATAKAVSVEGNVRVTRGDVVEAVSPGSILREGDFIYAAPLSSAVLAFSNGSIITVKENSGIALSQLSQAAYDGDAEYDELEADPSRSTTVLNLEYGSIDGHVKELRGDSRFEIETVLGTAAIRGTVFGCGLIRNIITGTVDFVVTNEDGTVAVIAALRSPPAFLPSGSARVGFDTSPDAEPSTVIIEPGTGLTTFVEADDPFIYPFIQNIYNRRYVQPRTPGGADPSPEQPQMTDGGLTNPGQNPGRSDVVPPQNPPEDVPGVVVPSADRPPSQTPPPGTPPNPLP